jgi:uncharacterized protein with GYD domain
MWSLESSPSKPSETSRSFGKKRKKICNTLSNWGSRCRAFISEGQYDFVVVAEAPDDQMMAAQALWVASHGNCRTELLHAFSLDEVGQIIQKMR